MRELISKEHLLLELMFLSCAHEQGPAWEAQCHADTHLMLSALQSLPLDPKTGPGTMDHLNTLCTLRFADPSPSGYTIPGQLPSPVSYSSASLASTAGTASSLAPANGAPSPTAGRQLQQVLMHSARICKGPLMCTACMPMADNAQDCCLAWSSLQNTQQIPSLLYLV